MGTMRTFGNMINEDVGAFKRTGDKSPKMPNLAPKKSSPWAKMGTKGTHGARGVYGARGVKGGY